MALFRFMWLRRLIRNNTNPIQEDRAALWKSRLAIAYMLIAWNAFGLVAYMCFTGKSDWAKHYGLKTDEDMNMSPGLQWAKTLGIENATVYKVNGLKLEKVKDDAKEASDATA